MKNTTIIIALMFLFSVSHAYAQEVGYRELLNLNAANIAKVNIGMSEAEVTAIMGNYTSAVRNGALNNPWKIERSGDASIYHYLTSKNPPFTPILEHQATPVLIKDGKVIGIGRGFLKEFRNHSMAPTNNTSSGKSIEERLAILKKLWDSGAIDKATYEAQRQKILDEI